MATVLLRGGFFPAGSVVFVGLAGATLLFAAASDERHAIRALGSSPVLMLIAIAGLSALSGIWSLTGGAEPLRAGLVVTGFAAVAVSGAVVTAARGGVERLAVVLVGVAFVEALIGLSGVALRETPWGERIGGSWRPGGTFEYPPALALLQVAALPAILRWMSDARFAVAIGAAAAAACSGEVLGLSDSRLQVGLAGLIVLASIAWPQASSRASRRGSLAAGSLLLASGVAAHAVAGGYAAPAASGKDLSRIVGLLAVAGAAALVWVPLRRWIMSSAPISSKGGRAASKVRLAAGIAAAAAILSASTLAVAAPVQGSGGFAHGRLGLWGDALSTAGERPLVGHGSGSFLLASQSAQESPPIRFAHNLPLEFAVELGLIGVFVLLTFYGACAWVALGARETASLWLFGPAVAAFLVTNLLDWTWHFAGAGAVFAAALGGLVSARWERPETARALAGKETVKGPQAA